MAILIVKGYTVDLSVKELKEFLKDETPTKRTRLKNWNSNIKIEVFGKRKNKPYSKNEVKYLKQAKKAGKSVKQMANKLHRTMGGVYGKLYGMKNG